MDNIAKRHRRSSTSLYDSRLSSKVSSNISNYNHLSRRRKPIEKKNNFHSLAVIFIVQWKANFFFYYYSPSPFDTYCEILCLRFNDVNMKFYVRVELQRKSWQEIMRIMLFSVSIKLIMLLKRNSNKTCVVLALLSAHLQLVSIVKFEFQLSTNCSQLSSSFSQKIDEIRKGY